LHILQNHPKRIKMPPHSATVRGTLSNSKTQAAISSNQDPPQIGDPISLSDSKLDSAPVDNVKPGSSSRPAESYRENEKESSSASGNSGENLPHSKKVRGTLGHEGGKEVNKRMLGDTVSLKAETHERDQDTGAGGEDGLEEAARMRGEHQQKSVGSKL
jgi:hypothetical protein